MHTELVIDSACGYNAVFSLLLNAITANYCECRVSKQFISSNHNDIRDLLMSLSTNKFTFVVISSS